MKLKKDSLRKKLLSQHDIDFFSTELLEYIKPQEFGFEHPSQGKIFLKHKNNFESVRELEFKAVPLGQILLSKQSRENKKIAIFFIALATITLMVLTTISFISNSSTSQVIKPSSTPEVSVSAAQNDLPETDYWKNREFPNRLCVVENDTEICDLSTTSRIDSYPYDNHRVVEQKGNSMLCVDMKTGVVWDELNMASNNPSYCVSDLGNVYIDPTIEVNKYWGELEPSNFGPPYRVTRDIEYDLCIWTHNDGSANIPCIEYGGRTGPQNGYNTKAFCRSGVKFCGNIYT